MAPATDRGNDVAAVDRVTDRRTDAPAVNGPTFEQRLARRLVHFDLTDAQTREIVTEASRLHEAGASRLVIRSSIVMNLYEFGVDAPFLYADSGGDDRPPGAHAKLHRFIAGLDVTPEQGRELHAMVHRLYEDGATRAEIRRTVHRQLATWGVDVNDGRAHRLHARAMRLDDRADRLHSHAHRLHVDDHPTPADASATNDDP